MVGSFTTYLLLPPHTHTPPFPHTYILHTNPLLSLLPPSLSKFRHLRHSFLSIIVSFWVDILHSFLHSFFFAFLFLFHFSFFISHFIFLGDEQDNMLFARLWNGTDARCARQSIFGFAIRARTRARMRGRHRHFAAHAFFMAVAAFHFHS